MDGGFNTSRYLSTTAYTSNVNLERPHPRLYVSQFFFCDGKYSQFVSLYPILSTEVLEKGTSFDMALSA
jgi:hypothetical protein